MVDDEISALAALPAEQFCSLQPTKIAEIAADLGGDKNIAGRLSEYRQAWLASEQLVQVAYGQVMAVVYASSGGAVNATEFSRRKQIEREKIAAAGRAWLRLNNCLVLANRLTEWAKAKSPGEWKGIPTGATAESGICREPTRWQAVREQVQRVRGVASESVECGIETTERESLIELLAWEYREQALSKWPTETTADEIACAATDFVGFNGREDHLTSDLKKLESARREFDRCWNGLLVLASRITPDELAPLPDDIKSRGGINRYFGRFPETQLTNENEAIACVADALLTFLDGHIDDELDTDWHWLEACRFSFKTKREVHELLRSLVKQRRNLVYLERIVRAKRIIALRILAWGKAHPTRPCDDAGIIAPDFSRLECIDAQLASTLLPVIHRIGVVAGGELANGKMVSEAIAIKGTSTSPANSPLHAASKPISATTENRPAKRSTSKGEAREKIIAALTVHHAYENGSCGNYTPIGNNKLASRVKVGVGTASRFFTDVFGGHEKYKVQCRTPSTLITALKMLNGEFQPKILNGPQLNEELDGIEPHEDD